MLKKYKEKYDNKEMRSVMHMFLPSVLGMVLCMSCMVGGTFAWFTASQSAGIGTVQSAEYEVAVKVGEDTLPANENGVYEYAVTAENSYAFTLKNTGTATKGYVIVACDTPNKSYVKQLNKGVDDFSFDVKGITGKITITPYWGTASKETFAANAFEYETQTVNSAAELNTAINARTVNTILVLGNDITGEFEVPEGRTITIDLNGHSITNAEGTDKSTITVKGDLSVVNGDSGEAKIVANGDSTNTAVTYGSGSKLSLNNVIIESTGNGVYGNGAELLIDKCKINVTRGSEPVVTDENGQVKTDVPLQPIYAVYTEKNASILNTDVTVSGNESIAVCAWNALLKENIMAANTVLRNCNVSGAGSSLITVESGSYIGSVVFDTGSAGKMQIKGGTFNIDPTTYLAEGFKAVESNGKWTVKKSE